MDETHEPNWDWCGTTAVNLSAAKDHLAMAWAILQGSASDPEAMLQEMLAEVKDENPTKG